jgi:hypothetical protein
MALVEAAQQQKWSEVRTLLERAPRYPEIDERGTVSSP